MNFKKHRRVWLGLLGVAVLLLLTAFYHFWLSRTKVAFVNFRAVDLQEYALANDNPFIKVYELPVDKIEDINDYDVAIISGMGLQITAEQRQIVQEAANSGMPIYTMMATNPDNSISTFTVDESALLQKYLMTGGRKNCRSLLNFLRRNVDGKIIFTGTVEPAVQKPADYLYFPSETKEAEEHEFATVADYEQYMHRKGMYFPGAKKILVTGFITDPTDLIKALVKHRYNVYPVSSFTRLPDFTRQICPDAIINLAHGRLGDEMVHYLSQHNIPIFDPLNVNTTTEEWEKDPMGMMGGFMSQSVVMPEIDGAIRTTALFALEKDKAGLLRPYAIPERLNTFVQTVDNYLALSTKPNAAKRLAIVYYKGPGQAALTASGMDVAQSLYATLKNLRQQGYNVNGLPPTLSDFKASIQREGSLFNAFAEGDAARFMKTGHPQIVTRRQYNAWAKVSLRADNIKKVDEQFGAFPGTDNHLQTAHGELAFPRIQYGNIVLLPQPIAGEGKDVFKIVHGTGQVPPHSYIAPYLWIQYGFKADALLHFGTHGSLEFTPQKQVALSNNDWADRLIGALPHFYYYTIDNVGEAMIAKRRSYAGLLSYLTPAFHESELRNQYKELENKVNAYTDNKGDRHALGTAIKQLTVKLGLHRDLGLDANLQKAYSDADIQRIADYAEELSSEKITGTPYVMGQPYTPEDLRSSVFSMTVDPVAYSLFDLDRLHKRVDANLHAHPARFNARYMARAQQLVSERYGATQELTIGQLCHIMGISEAELQKAHRTTEALNAPKGMAAMMMAASRKNGKGKTTGMAAMMAAMMKQSRPVPEAKNGPMAKFMRYQMRKMLAKKDPGRMLAVAKKMGASDEALKKMADALNKQMGIGTGGKHASKADNGPSRAETELAHAVQEVETSLRNVNNYKKLLTASPHMEMDALVNALNGGYTVPSPGGDVIANPNTLPTGRNLFAINAEETPTADAWEKGVTLAKNTIADYRKRHRNRYPRKVSYTLWSGEFIQTGGATIAQVLYMLGVEPVRDRYGRVHDLKLIPSDALGRPRIDVVVQTSGQLRDLAASRLFLINRAVKMAMAAGNDHYENHVKAGVEASERYLIDKGVSPKQARELSAYRVFGGAGGNYGTGIQSMVEQGNKWNSEKQLADMYINNMGAFYGDKEHWMADVHQAFGAALTRTDVVVQPRQNNTWGALSLDHVYEFMGGMNLAVRNVTGKDPDAYFSDYRNRNNYRMQDSKEAIGVEARTRILNPAYIRKAIKGGESSTDEIAEMVRNTYGWNVMKPRNIDAQLWNDIYEVYVKDKYATGVTEQMSKVNPAAMQEITATMMETARKGYWKATPQQLADIARVHTRLVKTYGPSGSSFEGNNPQLQQFIAGKASSADAQAYRQRYAATTQAARPAGKGMVLKKQTVNAEAEPKEKASPVQGAVVVGVVLVVFIAMLVVVRRKRSQLTDDTQS